MTYPDLHMLLAWAKTDDLRRQAAKAWVASEARAATGAHGAVAGALPVDARRRLTAAARSEFLAAAVQIGRGAATY